MRHPPLILDETFLIALSIKYGIYTAWGILAAWGGMLSIHVTAGPTGEMLWSAIVALVSAALIPMILSRKEKAEAVLTAFWLVFVAWYPTSLVWRFLVENNPPAPQALALSLGYLVIPGWRLLFLVWKNKKTDAD